LSSTLIVLPFGAVTVRTCDGFSVVNFTGQGLTLTPPLFVQPASVKTLLKELSIDAGAPRWAADAPGGMPLEEGFAIIFSLLPIRV